MFKEKWSKGKEAGCVVSDTPNRHGRDDNVNYYGGHLIAESIPKQEHVNLIAAAPDLLKACRRALHLVEDEENNKLIVEMPGSFGLLLDLREAIEKAEGREAKDV